jgi:hypothetical protein
MPNTYTLISSTVLSSAAASVTFSSIPQTYTDLVLKISSQGGGTGSLDNYIKIAPNSSTTTLSMTYLSGRPGTGVTSARPFTAWYHIMYGAGTAGGTSDGDGANVFDNYEAYIPNYTGSTNKVISGFGGGERNSTDAVMNVNAGLWRNTSSITSLYLTNDGGDNQWNARSSFYLYGIKNS